MGLRSGGRTGTRIGGSANETVVMVLNALAVTKGKGEAAFDDALTIPMVF